MPAHCCNCRRPLGLLEVTFGVLREDGGEDEWCEDCDAGLHRTLRPSLNYVPALLASINRGETSPPTGEQA